MTRAAADPHPAPATPKPVFPRALPPYVLAAAFLLMVGLDRLLPLTEWLHMPTKMWGWAPVLAGTGLCVAAAAQLRRHRTTILPFRTSDALITTGVFRRSRNPIYLGMLLTLVGTAVIAGSASVWIVPPLFAIVITRRFIAAEEAMLADRFGDAYHAYRRRVRRWV
ncbi:MAG: isoprenylcysteine carboxylmethyltransferase family protein [Planctomycetota bacterium]